MEPWVPHSGLDRLLERRTDPDWVAAQWSAPGARVIGVDDRSDVSASPAGDALRWITPGGAFDPEHHFLIGSIDGRPWFAVAATPQGPTASLRKLGGLLPETEVDLLMSAVALVNWHRDAGFCSRCGAATSVAEGGHTRVCAGCDAQWFPRMDPAVIVAVIDEDDRLLLGHRAGWDEDRVSILAGFVEAGESLEQAVHREILEESAVALTSLHYVGSQPWPLPRSLMLGFVAHARGQQVVPDGEEIEWARFFSRDEVDRLEASGELTLPMRASIASRIITAWREGDFQGAAAPAV